MTTQQKLAQLTQLNAVYIQAGINDTVTGPKGTLSLTDEQLACIGSVLNFEGAENAKAIQKAHLERDPLRIPLLLMQDVIHGCRTIYPVPLALGASFDTEIAEECSRMAAREAAAAGIHVVFAPMVDLARDPRWGRCMETTGEDPYLNYQMACAMVRGFQKDLPDGRGVAACVKHFAAYGQAEAGRDYNTTDMSEQTLRDYYLPAYRAAVEEGAKMVMTSFNALNGIPSAGNKRLVKGILREEWGFDGVVISDYDAVLEMRAHGYCETERDCAEKAMNATTDIEMMPASYLHCIPDLLKEGRLPMCRVDDAVRRVLQLKENLGLFDDPYRAASAAEEERLFLCAEHREIARRAAEASAVLLKNEGVLPFDKVRTKSIAVIGPFADRAMLGNWACYGREEEGISVFQGVRNLLPEAEVFYAEGCPGDIAENDCTGIREAAALAKSCDAVILCVGEASGMSGEAASRAELRLSASQKNLIREVVKNNGNTAAVLFCGRPLVLTDVIDDIPALAVAWQPGTEGGNALASLLFGEVNFSGKLPMTFPRSEGQIPIYYNCLRTGRPKPEEFFAGYCSWYLDMPNAPLFPFGYGLSYIEFALSSVRADKTEMKRGESITVSVVVENTGKRMGDIVIQLYICDEFASLVRPAKELKGFQKLTLQPGEKRQAAFEITEEMLKFWTAYNRFEAESGSFIAWISDSSRVKDGVRFRLLG